MNDIIKQKISKSRKEYLKNHPDEHPWKKSDKFKSKPCEHLKEILRKDFNFEEEYTDIRWKHNYSIDIAFLDKKLAIEVNGNQHYNNDGTLTEYYQKRHDYLKFNGWTIIELHYAACYKNDKILEVKDAIINCKNIDLEDHKLLFENKQKTKKEKDLIKEQKYEYAKENDLLDSSGRINGKKYKLIDLKKYKSIILSSNVNLMDAHFRKKLKETTNLSLNIINYVLKYFNIKHYILDKNHIKQKYIKKYNWEDIDRDNYNKIINSGIDLTKFGWVNKVSKITGLTRRQIARIVKLTELKNFVFIRTLNKVIKISEASPSLF